MKIKKVFTALWRKIWVDIFLEDDITLLLLLLDIVLVMKLIVMIIY